MRVVTVWLGLWLSAVVSAEEPDAEVIPEVPEAPEPAEAAPTPRRGRPVPPGTPDAFRDQRPTPPYAHWPRPEAGPFESEDACRAHFEATVPKSGRTTIRRFDAVYRRCEPTWEGWVYRESHAELTLDPILDPVLLIVPPAIVAAQWARNPDPAGRYLANGDYDAWRGPAAPRAGWRTYSEIMTGVSWGLTFAPLATSRGNAKLTDTIVMVEVAVVNASIATGLSLRSGEPPPLVDSDLRDWDRGDVWDVHDQLRSRQAFLSNVSGHTSVVSSTFFGLATLGALRAEGRPLKIAMPYVLASGLTALQGFARVQSLQADPVDVTIGALSGAAVGVLVPLSHAAIARVIDPERLKARQERRGAVTVTPTVGPSHVGLAGVF